MRELTAETVTKFVQSQREAVTDPEVTERIRRLLVRSQYPAARRAKTVVSRRVSRAHELTALNV